MKRFIIGFACGVLVFGLANVVSHFASSSPTGRTDRVLVYGFPFAVWIEGGLPSTDGELGVFALCGDIAIAMLCGTALGVFFVKRVGAYRTLL
jgi:hypothetical protein